MTTSMTQIFANKNEPVARRDLWLALAIGVTFATYHIVTAMTWSGPLEVYKSYSLFSTSLTLLIFVLLWVAYRRWRGAERSRRELQTIMRSLTTEAIMVVDIHRRVQACNDAVQWLFGRPPEEVVGLLTDALYDDRRNDKTCAGEIRACLEQHGFHRGQARGRRRDGTTFDLEITTERFRGESGAVLVLRDISARTQSEQMVLTAKRQVEEAYRELKKMEQMRDSLTHMIIHDMRTPLQVIMTMSELLARDLPGLVARGEGRDMVREIRDQAQSLTQLTHNALDVSRLEAGGMPLERSRQELRALLAAVRESLASLLREHEVTLDDDGSLAVAWCDPDIISRVVANLLTNARKFTPEGGRITLGLSSHDHQVRVEVRDTGPGLPADMCEAVFKKFVQADTPTARKHHSAGLGLAFCKLAVEAHGGQIGAISAPGQGACFWFTLPAERVVAEIAGSASA